ncbi:hypothetical protein COCOBI_13-0820 [Coccomyxa sp. Obi]|nr:hypothetical protein COCOBI_13-0820 [Coccomyxa sp. Obi]
MVFRRECKRAEEILLASEGTGDTASRHPGGQITASLQAVLEDRTRFCAYATRGEGGTVGHQAQQHLILTQVDQTPGRKIGKLADRVGATNSMWAMGSPFDAPHPRFQSAAAHLSSSIGNNCKKPPLSPSLPIDGEKSLPKSIGDFGPAQSLEHSASLSNISRRRTSSLRGSDFPTSYSLQSCQEPSPRKDASASESALLMPSSSSSESALQSQSSMQPQLPAASSLLQPLPGTASYWFLPRSLSGILAATGMLALLVMSVVILWPPSGNSSTPLEHLQQPPSLNLPRKFLDKIFGASQPQQMEHFTAAQGAGWGTGFGLEDASSQPGLEVIPSEDFTKFVSAHLGWEEFEDEPVSDEVAKARFEAAEIANDHPAHAGGFGEGLVTVSAKGVEHMAAATSAAVAAAEAAAKIEGRKELETAPLTPATPTKKSVGVIPTETINTGNPLSNSIGVVDPVNLLDSDKTTPSSTIKPRIAVQPMTTGGVNSGTTTSSGTTTTSSATTMGATQVVPTRTSSTTTSTTTGANGGVNTASQLRAGRTSSSGTSHSVGTGTGTSSVGSNQPLETMSSGQVSGVTQTGSMGGMFQPLAG